MKSLVTKSILAAALALSAVSAQAGTLNCDYLADGNGTPAPGLSRPVVEIGENRADVEIYIEGGRGSASRVNYRLDQVDSRTFVGDEGRASLTLHGASARLEVRGYTANCR